MDFKLEYNKIMDTGNAIALATSVNNIPNVRVVSFIYKDNVVYFATFNGSPKTIEFEANENVSFVTLKEIHVRVNNAKIKKSDKTFYELKSEFIARIPEYKTLSEQMGDILVVYEIHFDKASVIMDLENPEIINF